MVMDLSLCFNYTNWLKDSCLRNELNMAHKIKKMKLELTLRENWTKFGIMKVAMSGKSKTQPIFSF